MSQTSNSGASPNPVAQRKQRRGQLSYHKGVCAEQSVAAAYVGQGAEWLEERWRGVGGEIDLIFRQKGVYVFCEVKAAVSFDDAMRRLHLPQVRRIHAAASEYLASTPNGQLSEVRFDFAVVNGNGEVVIRQNAIGHF